MAAGDQYHPKRFIWHGRAYTKKSPPVAMTDGDFILSR